MAAAEYFSNAPLNPSNLTPRAPTPTSQAIPYGADADASYTYDSIHDQPTQFSQPPSSSSNLNIPGAIVPSSSQINLNANTSYEQFRPSSAHSMHSAPGDLQHTGNPTLIGPDGEMIESDRGLFGSSGNGSGKSKSEKVLKFVIKQVEKQMNKQSSGQGQGQQQQEQYNQYMQEYTSGQENPYANAEGTYGDYSQMGGGEGHGFSEFLHGGSGGDGGHSWLESLGLSSGGDSSGDSSALEAIFVG